MNLDDIREILDLVREHELSEFELEHEGLKIRVRKDAAPIVPVAPPAPPPPVSRGTGASRAVDAAARNGVPPAVTPEAQEAADAVEDAVEFAMVKSPIVGTFYRAAEPGAPPFADIGDRVKQGQVLCIIEAMKLMNEINSEFDGDIAKVYVENGQPVQYGERLFAIRTTAT